MPRIVRADPAVHAASAVRAAVEKVACPGSGVARAGGRKWAPVPVAAPLSQSCNGSAAMVVGYNSAQLDLQHEKRAALPTFSETSFFAI